MAVIPRHHLDITFCVPGLPYDGETLKTKSLGGSESAGYYMARALADRGHRVKAFTNTPQASESDGVSYMPLQSWQGYARAAQSDVHIVQRMPELTAMRINTKLNLLWQHDLALHRAVPALRSVKWAVDKVILLSKFHAEQYKAVAGYDDSELFITRNGFDFNARPATRGLNQRDPDLFVYCARPERGLDRLVREVLPDLLKRRPSAKIVVATYDNTIPQLAPFQNAINEHIRANRLPVVYAGALTKNQLYDLMSRAAAYLYPSPSDHSPEFREISCIAAIEAQACGLPFIHTGWGALTETAPHSPVTTVANMAREAARLVLDPERWAAVQRAQYDHVRDAYDWDNIAAEWEDMFFAEIAKNNDCPYRLARWFYQRSEIEGAKLALEKCADLAHRGGYIDAGTPGTYPLATKAANLFQEIGKLYSFAESDAAYAKHYEAYGLTTLDDLRAKRKHFTADFLKQSNEPRFHCMAQVIRDKQPGSVLDFGCGHGWSTLYLAGNFPTTRFDGVDVDPGALDWADMLLREEMDPALDVRFTSVTDPERAPYDMAILSEVLEHVRDPVATLEHVERHVRPGGTILITVPFGPWEYGGQNWSTDDGGHGFRQHVRELSQADLHDMLMHKPEFSCASMQQINHRYLGDPCGFYLVTYKADHSPVRPRDMVRKMAIQRPPQTVSANIIAHAAADQTLRWCLDSLKHVVDEVIVGNTGGKMSAAGLAACADYGAKVIPAPDPLIDGFSAARNAVLDASVMDFVLWVDTDERLIEPHELRKFLRQNAMAGYTIKQVHMAADQEITPDTPVRLFRRNSGCRFHGLIHEHPETAINKGPGMVCILQGNPVLWHIGYSSTSVRAHRFFRNRPLLERDRRETPERALGMFLEARDQLLLANETIARANLGAPPGAPPIIPDGAKHHAELALAMCRAYWKANVGLAGVTVDTFYADALRILGRGFDASIEVRLARDGVGEPGLGPNGEHTLRFEAPSDLDAFLARSLRDKVESITKPYW